MPPRYNNHCHALNPRTHYQQLNRLPLTLMDSENTLTATGIMTAVDLLFCCIVLALTIINMFNLRTFLHLFEANARANEKYQASNAEIIRAVNIRFDTVEGLVRELLENQKAIRQEMHLYTGSLKRIESRVVTIRDTQVTYLNKNASEANGNAVNIYKNQKSPEQFQTDLLNTLLSRLVDNVQGKKPENE